MPGSTVDISRLRISTNRTFDLDGNETTGTAPNAPANALTTHLLGSPISPVDRWTLALELSDNPFLQTVTSTDAVQVDLSDLNDIVMIVEYEEMNG